MANILKETKVGSRKFLFCGFTEFMGKGWKEYDGPENKRGNWCAGELCDYRKVVRKSEDPGTYEELRGIAEGINEPCFVVEDLGNEEYGTFVHPLKTTWMVDIFNFRCSFRGNMRIRFRGVDVYGDYESGACV